MLAVTYYIVTIYNWTPVDLSHLELLLSGGRIVTEAVTHIGEGGVVAHGPHTGAHLTGQGVAALISVHPDMLSSLTHQCAS